MSLFQVTVIVDASDAEEFSELFSKPLRSLPYDSPGQTFVAFEKPEGLPTVGKFSNTLKFIVKEVLIFTSFVNLFGEVFVSSTLLCFMVLAVNFLSRKFRHVYFRNV